MTLLDYLRSDLIVFLEAGSRDEALQTLTDVLDSKGRLKDKGTFQGAIVKRERIVSTGIGMGVAIPHAKLEGYEDFFLVFGIQSKAGIDWDAIDGAPVRLIFMIGGPEERQNEYLNILSQLTTIIKDDQLRARLLKATDPSEVLTLFKDSLGE